MAAGRMLPSRQVTLPDQQREYQDRDHHQQAPVNGDRDGDAGPGQLLVHWPHLPCVGTARRPLARFASRLAHSSGPIFAFPLCTPQGGKFRLRFWRPRDDRLPMVGGDGLRSQSRRNRVAELNRTNATGWLGIGLLILAWAFVYLTEWPRHGTPNGKYAETAVVFAAGAITALVSLVLAIACGRKRSRWWYLLAAASLISVLVLVADLLVGD